MSLPSLTFVRWIDRSTAGEEMKYTSCSLCYSSLSDLSKTTEESFFGIIMRLYHNNAIVIECTGSLTPCSQIKISFKSRGKSEFLKAPPFAAQHGCEE